MERILRGESVREEWVSMICDTTWVTEQEQRGRQDSAGRPKKSSICRYFADNRGCKKSDQECHFAHIEWPTEIRNIMLNSVAI